MNRNRVSIIFLPLLLSLTAVMVLEPAFANEAAGCNCEGISSFDTNTKDLESRDIKFIQKCKEKLYASYSKDKSCPAEYAAINSEIERRKQSKESAIDKALSFEADAFDFYFNAGYEFTSVNTLWTKGNPRVALGLYRTMFGTNLHLSSQIMLTDAGDQQPVTVGTGGKIGPLRSLDFETLLFSGVPTDVSYYGSKRDFYIGPVALWGAKKLDANNLALTRHYFGLRGTPGSQTYTDILVGRAENVSGTRLLIRGQMPFNFPGTDQIIYLGLEGNLAIKNRKNNPSPETIKGYMVWDIDNLFSAFGDNEK